jgi:hypothetical protein
MNKLLISIAAAGLGALAFSPAVLAQDSSSEAPAMSSDDTNQVSAEEFDKADLDKSGELSFDEAITVLPTLTQADFDRLDANDNGTLSLAEIGNTPQNGSLLSNGSDDSSSSEQGSSQEPSAQ